MSRVLRDGAASRRALRRAPLIDVTQSEFGFAAWRGAVSVMSGSHTHTDIEINRVESGRVTYLAGGRIEEIHEGEWAVFWAGMPHELLSVAPGSAMTWVIVPLAWFLQWQLPEPFPTRLLEGDFIREDAAPARAIDDHFFARWVQDARGGASPDEIKTMALEVEARLRRLAATAVAVPPAVAGSREATTGDAASAHVEAMARCMTRRYREDLSVADIAAAARLNPGYAMEIWKRTCGLTVWDYLVRLRLSHAQRLLLTTDWKISRVATESGFGSAARFYAAFQKRTGTAPRAWRKRAG